MRADARLRYGPDSCLPARYPRSGCRRCADACPAGALSIGEAGPILRDGCVDCGQCVAHCPTGALALPGFPSRRATHGEPRTVDCWRVPLSQSPPGTLRVPCLGGLSPAALLELTDADSEGPTLLDRGFCGQCAAGGSSHPLVSALEEAQGLLAALGFEPERWPRLVSRRLPLSQMAGDGGEPLLEERLSRRALLTGLKPSAPASPQGAEVEGAVSPRTERERLLAALDRLAPGAPLPARLVPSLAASDACANHQVCASACPVGALQSYQGQGAAGIAFDPVACVSCGLCVELCPGQALSLGPPGLPEGDRRVRRLTRFTLRTCPECGAEHTGETNLCPPCGRDRGFARDALRTLFGDAA